MKKSTLLTTILLVFVTLLSTNLNAQEFKDLDKSPMDVASFPSSYKESNKLVKIAYSRPQLKGRDLQKLATNGEVWRTGANEATEITFYIDMKLGSKTIKTGTYSLFTIPGEKEWTIILSSDINVWGAYSYNEANDVVRFNVPVKIEEELLETFSIAFEKSNDGVDMHLGWGNARIAVPFTK